jgi:protein-tyrosine kinase
MQKKDNFEILLLKRIKRIFQMYWRHTVVFMLLACSATAVHHGSFPRFKAMSSMHVKTPEDSALLSVIGRASGFQWSPYSGEPPSTKFLKILQAQNFDEFVITSIKTRGYKDEIIKQVTTAFEIAEGPNWERNVADAVLGSTSFSGKEDFIYVHANSTTLDRAVYSSKFVMELGLVYLTVHERKEIAEAERYLNDQQLEVQAKIDKMNLEIELLRGNEYALDSNGGEGSFLVKSLTRLKEEEQMVIYKLEETELLLKKFARMVRGVANVKDPQLEALQIDSIDSLQSARGRLPDRIRLLVDEREVLKVRQRAVTSQIEKLAKDLKPKAEQQMMELRRKIELENSFYQQLQKQRFENRVYQISIDNRVQAYEVANHRNAGREIPFLYKLIVVSMISGTFLIVAVVAWQKLFPLIAYKEDFQSLGIKYIGSIPDMQPLSMKFNRLFRFKSKRPRQDLIHSPFVRSYVGTSFQVVGTRIVQNFLRIRQIRRGVLSLVSQRSGDGKSVVAANLAVYFGSYGFKTLMIHADWIRFKKNNYLEVETKLGLSDIFGGRVKRIEEIIVKTKYENVYLLGPGSDESATEMFKDKVYAMMITKLRQEYDMIIIDTPAMEVGTEGLELTEVADMTIVVARAFKSEVASFAEVVESLNIKGINQVHGLINCTDPEPTASEMYVQPYVVNDGNGGGQSAS